MKIFCTLILFFVCVQLSGLQAKPDAKQIEADAANFHQFRIAIVKDTPADANAAFEKCRNLAHRTSPDYIYGMVTDLMRDDSRTEEPYLIAIMVLDRYPPEPARTVVKKIIADTKYKACEDVKNWLWEIDQAHPPEKAGTAQIIRGADYRGVIVTPAMIEASSSWKRLDADYKKNVKFWTPSDDEIDRAEQALSARLLQDQSDSQSGGFLYQNYYTPKHISRDRVKRSDEDPIYYTRSQNFCLHPRQYFGFTVGGEKRLEITFLEKTGDASARNSWDDQAFRISYLPESNRFDPAGLVVLEDR